MGGITIAPHIPKSNNDSFLSFNPDSTQLNSNPTMDELLQSAHNWPVEDLTSEVQDLLLRESMSWLPWVDTTNDVTLTNNKNNDPLEGLDPQLLAQSLQLDSLFGQEINFDQLDEVAQSSLLYDELTYVPSTDNSPLSTPSVQEEVFEEVLPENEDDNTDVLLPTHHQNDLPKNDNVNDINGDSSSSDEEEEEAKDNNDIQVNVTNNEDEEEDDDDDDSTDDDSTDDDSDDEDEENGIVDVRTTSYMYLPKRQIEEALLEKITHRLHADKLPGILSIVSASNDNEQREEEVEIDLSSLGKDQLVRVMLYVDACIEEQQGGPSVKLSNYIVKDPKSVTSSIINKKHQEENDTFTEIDNHELNAGQKRKRKSKSPSITSTPIDGPISMAGLTKRTRVNGNKKKSLNPSSVSSNNNSSTSSPVSKRRRKTTSSRRKQQDSSVSMKVKQNGVPSNRPKRRAALHKRRMLEETLLTPSDDDNDDDISITPVSTPAAAVDHEVLIVYSDEQMDFGVVENQTIVHQPSVLNNNSNTTIVSQAILQTIVDDDEDDEEIDIM